MWWEKDVIIFDMEDIPKTLIDAGIVKKFHKDDILFSNGDKPSGMYILNKGVVVGSSISLEGKTKINCILKPYTTVGDPQAIATFELPMDFICLTEVETVYVSREEMIRIMKKDFDVVIYLFKAVVSKLNTFAYQSSENVLKDSEYRICSILVNFINSYGKEENNEIKINFDISLNFIADVAGVNKLTVVRTFNKLKELNLMEKREGHYYITNLDEIEKFAIKTS